MNFAQSYLLALPVTAWLAAALPDDQWPPGPDPQWDPESTQVIGNPAPTSNLFLDGITFDIDDPNTILHPVHDNLRALAGHYELDNGNYQYNVRYTIGDVDNDGLEDDVVITNGGTFIWAAEMKIDYDAVTGHPTGGQLLTHWYWVTPYGDTVFTVDDDNDGIADYIEAGGYSTDYQGDRNALVWNYLTDGPSDDTNEVLFMGLDVDPGDPTKAKNRLYIFPFEDMKADFEADGQISPSSYVQTPNSVNEGLLPRLGIARVRNSAFPRDLVTSSHSSAAIYVWPHDEPLTGPTYNGSNFSNPFIEAKSHEANWADVDGDGFDEFALNGVVDYVDADAQGNHVDTYPQNRKWGQALFQIVDAETAVSIGGGTEVADGAHCDQCIIGDWDPSRPGLEVRAVPEEDESAGSGGFWLRSWLDPTDPAAIAVEAYDLMFDADCGTFLKEWFDAPAVDGQNIYGGNWTTRPGFECISSPKDDSQGALGQVIPPSQIHLTGSYATSFDSSSGVSDFSLLAIDGAHYNGFVNGMTKGPFGPDLPLRVRSRGPWRGMQAIDWDGDYSTDEILHHAFSQSCLMMFRMRGKDKFAPGVLPGIDDVNDVLSAANYMVPDVGINEAPNPGCSSLVNYPYWYYLGTCATNPGWAWDQGGPGRGSHFYQKLKEVFPGTGKPGATEVGCYDLHGSLDHREEILAITTRTGTGNTPEPKFHIYFNTDPLSTVERPTPRGTLAYSLFKQSKPASPYSYQDEAVAIERFHVRPVDASLPSNVVGIDALGSIDLRAFVEFANGHVEDVTDLCTLEQDAASAPLLYSTGGNSGTPFTVTSATSFTGSGRFRAVMPAGDTELTSEPTYVFSSSSNEPVILRAGYTDSWLVDGAGDRDLVIEALLAHRNNVGLVGKVHNADKSPWKPAGNTGPQVELLDDGLGADRVAGDGIYTAVVSDTSTLDLDENFKVIVARTTSIVQPIYPKKPWPYYAVNTTGFESWQPYALYNLDPTNQFELDAYQGPRVRSMGYRGMDVPGFLAMEMELEISPLVPLNEVDVVALIQGVPAPVPLVDEGDGLYSLTLTTGTVPNGLYLNHIAVSYQLAGQTRYVDLAPQLELHQTPSWGPGDTAPTIGVCGGAVGW